MKTPRFAPFIFAALLLVFTLLFVSCGQKTPDLTQSPPTTAPTVTVPPPTPTASAVPPTPTPTPEPLAVVVNGEGVRLADFQAEVARYKLAVQESGTNLATNEQEISQQVLDDLINQCLLSQEARAKGFTADDAVVQARIDQLVQKLGSQQALTDWMAANLYSETEFRYALQRSIEAAWMRDQIIQDLPELVEQIHARQILLYNLEDANQVLSLLRSGQDFTELAVVYNPTTGGDLGWFPRGILLDAGLEEVAFQLQPGQYSEIIQTLAGYHILQVIERSTGRAVDPSARLILQENFLRQWLQNRLKMSDIEIVVGQ